ncbi:hypothetical protein CRYUN_Cryun06bG0006600 [Craigia yunnanensis]
MAGNRHHSSFPLPGEWVKGKVIGSGSFGTVHLAMNKCMGRELSKESNGDSKISIFMEYMAGGSLSDVAEKFGGCKNVLLGSSGNVKLTDFGCAKRPKDMKNNGELRRSWQSVGGTPLWMAPEVLRNEGLAYASDIWSLGCTVIEMAAGRPPWSDEVSNPVAAILKIAFSNQMPRFPSHFSREGLDFLSKCLERHPKRRWTVEELLEHPFILGTSVRNSKIDGSCSPASILDIGMYDSGYDSDEPAGSSNEGEALYINPFSTRHCLQRNGTSSRQQAESGLEPLDDYWITVRSGGQF